MAKTNVVKLPISLQNEMRDQARIDHARAHNKKVALDLAAAGIPVFPADPKTKSPYVKAFDRLDSDISEADTETLRRDFYDKHGFSPLHIGATLDKSAIRRMFREKPDALPAISLTRAGLLVVDNDIKERNGVLRNGVELFELFCEPHGGLPDGVVSVESQGKGRHLYFANDAGMGCSAGRLKAECETDVKAIGGYVIAPAAIRIHDGRRYGDRAGLDALIKARAAGSLAPVPQFLKDAIGARMESSSVSERDVQALTDKLRASDIPDGAALLDPVLDGVDWRKLVDNYDSLRTAIEEGDRSDTRYHLARALKTERPEITSAEFAAILFEKADECGEFVEDEKPSQGEYNWRNIERDFQRAKPLAASRGEVFDAVEDEENQPVSKTKADKLAKLDAGFMWGTEVAKNFEPDNDVIEGLLPASGVVALQGDSNVGKTFVALEMLDCVSRGSKFLGRNVVQGGAMLIAGEGRAGMKKRLAALYIERPCDGRGIAAHVDLPNFGKDVETATRKLERIITRYSEIQGHGLALLVLDNLTRMIGGEDMNLAKSVSEVFDALECIAQKHRLCIVVIHHWNKTGKGAGSYAIRAAFDNVYDVVEEKAGVKAITGDKMRDEAKGARLRFKLHRVVLGLNQWRNEVSSCVVVECLALEPVEIDDEDAPTIKVSDRREDRISAVLDVFEREAKRQAADDESVSTVRRRLELQSGEIEQAVNVRRTVYGLEPLGRSTVRDHINAAVEAGTMEVVGTKARPLYRVTS